MLITPIQSNDDENEDNTTNGSGSITTSEKAAFIKPISTQSNKDFKELESKDSSKTAPCKMRRTTSSESVFLQAHYEKNPFTIILEQFRLEIKELHLKRKILPVEICTPVQIEKSLHSTALANSTQLTHANLKLIKDKGLQHVIKRHIESALFISLLSRAVSFILSLVNKHTSTFKSSDDYMMYSSIVNIPSRIASAVTSIGLIYTILDTNNFNSNYSKTDLALFLVSTVCAIFAFVNTLISVALPLLSSSSVMFHKISGMHGTIYGVADVCIYSVGFASSSILRIKKHRSSKEKDKRSMCLLIVSLSLELVIITSRIINTFENSKEIHISNDLSVFKLTLLLATIVSLIIAIISNNLRFSKLLEEKQVVLRDLELLNWTNHNETLLFFQYYTDSRNIKRVLDDLYPNLQPSNATHEISTKKTTNHPPLPHDTNIKEKLIELQQDLETRLVDTKDGQNKYIHQPFTTLEFANAEHIKKQQHQGRQLSI